MFAEQEVFRQWLLHQTPEEILHHCYAYTSREDILLALEYHDLSDSQCKALLKSPTPLEDVFQAWEKRETSHMEDVQSTIESRTNAVLRADSLKARREER